MADTFKVTAYDKVKDVVTVDFKVDPRTNFAGGTYNGVKISGIPKDSVANVKAFFRSYVDGYINGKIVEQAKEADIATEVAALLNVTTDF